MKLASDIIASSRPETVPARRRKLLPPTAPIEKSMDKFFEKPIEAHNIVEPK